MSLQSHQWMDRSQVRSILVQPKPVRPVTRLGPGPKDWTFHGLLLFSFLFLSTQSLVFFMVICCADICKSFSFPLQSFYLNYTMYTLYITQNYNADIQLCIPKHMVKWQKLLAYPFFVYEVSNTYYPAICKHVQFIEQR